MFSYARANPEPLVVVGYVDFTESYILSSMASSRTSCPYRESTIEEREENKKKIKKKKN